MLMFLAVASIDCVAQAQNIVIHVVDGRNGHAISHQHLLVFEGNSQETRQLTTHVDLQTDGEGTAMLPVNDPSVSQIQVWVDFRILCQSQPNGNSYSVDKIRTTGLSTPNDCGSVVRENTPNNFVVFARPAHWWEQLRR
jgi:hypothetical protein